MARVAITIKTLKGTLGNAQTDLTLSGGTSSDPTNDHEWLFQRGDLLLARNTHATLARNVVLIGGGDYQGRTLTSSKSLAAGDEVIFGRLEENGWVDPTNGMVLVNVDGNAGDVRFWVLR